MALSERKVLKQVTIINEHGIASVQWANQILRDEEVISETFERKTYSAEQINEFTEEVEKAELYIPALGWT